MESKEEKKEYKRATPSRKRKAKEDKEEKAVWVVACVEEGIGKALIDFHCGICQALPVDPLQTPSCHHIYCRTCIQQAVANKPTCPMDNTPLVMEDMRSLHEVNKSAHRVLSSLQVKCPLYADKGCTWVGDYSRMDIHIDSECGRHRVACKHCGDMAQRRHMEAHVSACDLRPLACSLCTKKIALAHMSKHLETECIAFMVECSTFTHAHEGKGCGKKMARGELAAHQLTECAQRLVDCPLSVHGCHFRAPPAAHAEHNVAAVHKHLALLSIALVDCRQRLERKTSTEERKTQSGGMFYVVGGGESGAFYDTERKVWVKMSGNNDSLRDASATQIDQNRIIVTGGYHCRSVEIYDRLDHTWKKAAPLEEPRASHASVFDGECLFVFGGGGMGVHDGKLDFHSNKWSKLATTNSMRFGMSVLLFPFFYMFGGTDDAANALTKVARKFNLLTKKIDLIAPMPQARWGGSAVALSDHLILVMGGTLYSGVSEYTAWIYDVHADKWLDAPSEFLDPDLHRLDGGAFITCDILHVVGGGTERVVGGGTERALKTNKHTCFHTRTYEKWNEPSCPSPCSRFAHVFCPF